MAVVSSCREILGEVPQRAQPSPLVAIGSAGHSRGTAGDKPEEGGDDVKSSWPLWAGLHTCYNGGDNGQQGREAAPIPKSRQIGRASCRERVCQYVTLLVVAVSLKKKKK